MDLSRAAAVSWMQLSVALSAQRNQVLFHVTTRLASEGDVVYLQLLHAAAPLTSPAIALHYLPMQFTIVFGLQSESRGLG